MNKERYISHGSDLSDAIGEIKQLRYPFMLVTNAMPPQKQHHESEYEIKRKQMAHFFRSVVPTYAKCAGITEEQARGELQIKFCRTAEVLKDESGEYDLLWLEEDKFRVFEQGKAYHVQSVASMSNAELADFINKSKDYVLQQYGVNISNYTRKYKTKEL